MVKTGMVKAVIALLGAAFMLAACLPASNETKAKRAQTMDLVKGAVVLIEERGDAALPAFYQLHWQPGEFYVFVLSMEGVNLAHPAQPHLVGKNLLDRKDSNGVSPTAMMVQMAELTDEGWLSYRWPKPGEQEESSKHSYFTTTMMDGNRVIVGSGYYD